MARVALQGAISNHPFQITIDTLPAVNVGIVESGLFMLCLLGNGPHTPRIFFFSAKSPGKSIEKIHKTLLESRPSLCSVQIRESFRENGVFS